MSTVKLRVQGANAELECAVEATLLDALRSAGLAPDAPCGGQGKCGKCAVFLLGADGTRERVLACRTPAGAAKGRSVVLPEALAGGEIQLGGGSAYGAGGLTGFAAALDIGTTTLAARIIDRASGAALASASAWSAQLPYGADVVSRIKYASEPGGLVELCGLVRSQARDLILEACADALVAPEEIAEALCVGNTTMEHIFAGLSPASLGAAPYTPASYFTDGAAGRDPALPNAAIRCAPCISGYVGGDTAAAIYACGMASAPGLRLLLDIGTNGELVIGGADGLKCCSVACGPAFEGAEISCGTRSQPGAVCAVRLEGGAFRFETVAGATASGICGSGIVDLLACLLEAGAIDGSGLLLTPDEAPEACRAYLDEDENGLGVFTLAPEVTLTAADVRKLQLAKAAVRAGIELLLAHAGARPQDIEEAYLAGGFGTRVDTANAAKIGLIPPELAERTRGIGNAALSGAQRALCEPDGFERLLEIRRRCEYIELAGSAEFAGAFVDAMAFYEDEEEDY